MRESIVNLNQLLIHKQIEIFTLENITKLLLQSL